MGPTPGHFNKEAYTCNRGFLVPSFLYILDYNHRFRDDQKPPEDHFENRYHQRNNSGDNRGNTYRERNRDDSRNREQFFEMSPIRDPSKPSFTIAVEISPNSDFSMKQI